MIQTRVWDDFVDLAYHVSAVLDQGGDYCFEEPPDDEEPVDGFFG